MSLGLLAKPAPLLHEERLEGQVEQALCGSGRCELRRVRVSAMTGGVRLNGTVGSYFMKQMAQSIALATAGVLRVANDVEVR
jgi:osmotically-inducible protein OsmY